MHVDEQVTAMALANELKVKRHEDKLAEHIGGADKGDGAVNRNKGIIKKIGLIKVRSGADRGAVAWCPNLKQQNSHNRNDGQ